MTTSYSPVLTTKAVKDETEQQILRDAHVRKLCTDILRLYMSKPPTPWWLAAVKVINPASSMLADGTKVNVKPQIHFFLEDGFCHLR